LIGCVSPGGAGYSNGDGAATKLAVATIDGVWQLHRLSPEDPWIVAAQSLSGHHIGSLVYVPERDLLFAGAHSGGLFASADRGRTWAPAMHGIAEAHQHVFTIAAQQRAGGTVLWAGMQPPALYRSDDFGRTWVERPGIRNVPGTAAWNFPAPPFVAHVKYIAVHASDPHTLYVCVEQGALLKSTDDGVTWRELAGYASPEDIWHHDAHRIVFHREDAADLYFTSGEGLYRSTDAGESWTHLTTRHDRIAYPDAIFLDPDDERIVYIAGAASSPDAWSGGEKASANACVLRSRDAGHSWEQLDDGLPQPMRGNIEALTMHCWHSNVAFYAGSALGEVFASENRGESWELVTAALPPISKVGHYKKLLPAAESMHERSHS